MSNTLLLAENIRTGYDANTPYSNWGSIDSRRTKFFFSHHVCKDNVCVAVGINLSLANSGDHAINSGKTQAEGESPWPNSFHPGGVCVSFADGRAQFLSQDIAGRVHYNLMTPQGIRLNGTDLDGGVLSDNEY